MPRRTEGEVIREDLRHKGLVRDSATVIQF